MLIGLVIWPSPFPTAYALGGWTFWLALTPIFFGVWLGLTKEGPEAREWTMESARSWHVPFLARVHWMGCVPHLRFGLFVCFILYMTLSFVHPFKIRIKTDALRLRKTVGLGLRFFLLGGHSTLLMVSLHSARIMSYCDPH